MRPVFMFCAEGVVIDHRTNNVSAYSILEDVSSVGFPFLMGRFYAICMINREASDDVRTEANFEIKLENNVIFTVNTEIDFQDKPKTRTILEVQGLVIPGPGLLKVSLLRTGAAISSYEFLISQINQTAIATATNQ
jgi:hypothetical protein